MTAGYSGTPLAKKLGIKEGFSVLSIDAPSNYSELLAPLPPNVEIALARALSKGETLNSRSRTPFHEQP